MINGLKVYWMTCLDRRRELPHEDVCPGKLIRVQDLSLDESVCALKIEIDRVDTKINDFKAEIIETLRRDMEKKEEEIIMKLKET